MAIGSSETINIEVSSNIKSVIRDTDKLAKSMKKVQAETQELGKGTKAGAQGFTGVRNAVRKLGFAIKSIGIGMLIAAFIELKNMFSKNQTAIDTLSHFTESYKIILEQLSTAIGNLSDYVSSSSGNFTKLTSVVMSFLAMGLLPLKQAYASTELVIRSIGNVTMTFLSLFTGKYNKRMIENQKEMKRLWKDMKKNGEEFKMAASNIAKNFKGAYEEIKLFAKEIGGELEGVDMGIAKRQAQHIINAEKRQRKEAARAAIEIARLEQQMQAQQALADNESLTFAKREDALKSLQTLQRKVEKEESAAAAYKLKEAKKLHNKYKDNVDMKIALDKASAEQDLLDAKHLQNKKDRLAKTKKLEEEIAEVKFQLSLEGKSEQKKEELELERAYEKKKEMAIANNVDLLGINEQYEMDKAAIEERYREDKEEKDEESTEKEISLKEFAAEQVTALFDAINASMDARAAEIEKNYNDEVKLAKGNVKALEGIEKKFEAERAALAEKQKKVQVGMATITMLQSVVSAYNQGMSVPPPAGLIMGPVAAGIAALAGLANIRQILATDVGSGGGGGGGSVSAAATPETPAPEMMSGSFSLEGGKPVEPLQAYVVSDDITDSQDKLAIIRRRATI